MIKLRWPYGKAIEGPQPLKLPASVFSVRVMTRLLVGVVALTSACSIAMPALAVERVNVRVGKVEQSVPLSDLERFAETGEVSNDLKPFTFVLTPDVQRVLGERLELNPEQTDKLINDLLNSPAGDRILKAVDLAFPGTNVEQIQIALMLAARQANGVSITRVLRALPGESMTVDLSALISAISTIKLPPLAASGEQ